MKKLIAAMAFAGVASASADFVEDLSISGSFDYESEYIFRGQELGQHSFQPGVEAGYEVLGGDAYAGIWSSMEIDNSNTSGTDEIDFYVGYAIGLDQFVDDVPVTADIGFTYYMYPDRGGVVGVDRSREVYIGFSADVIASPALYYYYDFDLEQSTIELSVGHSLDLAEFIDVDASLDLGAYFGFVDTGDTTAGQGATDPENGYTYGGISADVVYALSENASASVGVRYAANNDGNATGEESNLWFGSTISFAK